jgi:hypothetical protein
MSVEVIAMDTIDDDVIEGVGERPTLLELGENLDVYCDEDRPGFLMFDVDGQKFGMSTDDARELMVGIGYAIVEADVQASTVPVPSFIPDGDPLF